MGPPYPWGGQKQTPEPSVGAVGGARSSHGHRASLNGAPSKPGPRGLFPPGPRASVPFLPPTSFGTECTSAFPISAPVTAH